jgi:hypothetical protein
MRQFLRLFVLFPAIAALSLSAVSCPDPVVNTPKNDIEALEDIEDFGQGERFTTLAAGNAEEWENALRAISRAGNYIININAGFALPGLSGLGAFSFEESGIIVSLRGSGGQRTLSLSGNGSLLRIMSGQTVIVRNLCLAGNDANSASLVYAQGALEMKEGAKVTGNAVSGTGDGGGVYVDGGTFTMSAGAEVSGNKALGGEGGGVYVDNFGGFQMRGEAKVSGNAAKSGGGVYIYVEGAFTMDGNAAVLDNEALDEGGGVMNVSGTMRMGGSALVSGNSAKTGGGLRNSDGKITIKDSAVISHNTADEGGGAAIKGETFAMQDRAAVLDNTASHQGGGVFISEGTFTMRNHAVISRNTVSGTGRLGGGVYVFSSGDFDMRDSASVSFNRADLGGGVYADGSSFTMSGDASIFGNTAGISGGGVYAYTFRKAGGTVQGCDNSHDPAQHNPADNERDNCNVVWSGGPITDQGAALYIGNSGTAEYGAMDGDIFTKEGQLATTDDTF